MPVHRRGGTSCLFVASSHGNMPIHVAKPSFALDITFVPFFKHWIPLYARFMTDTVIKSKQLSYASGIFYNHESPIIIFNCLGKKGEFLYVVSKAPEIS